MKKIWIFLLCVVLSAQSLAADIEITENFEVQVNKEAVLAALYEADIVSIRKAIDLGLISCYELTNYCLERIEAYNDTFHCFITLCDNALQIARERDEAIADGTATGSLFGIPIVVKDNIDYEGYLTTNGLSCGTAASESAAVVQQLLDEGVVIIGKTNMSAGAQDAICSVSDTGLQTFNAYNPRLASGGSSGGSAAAVSLNFAVAGLGTDTNSSLRYPSALNGCIALRTTIGLLDREGCVILNPGRDTVGAITRSVRDQAIMLDVMSDNAYCFTGNLNADALNGMRIGVLTELSYPLEYSSYRNSSCVDEEILRAFDNALAELESCGAQIVTVSAPSILSDIESDRDLEATLDNILSKHQVSVLVYPAYLHTPHYALSEDLGGASVYSQTYITNCNGISSRAGAPEITVPIGQHSGGAGIAMEIISSRGQDQLLLNIAYAYTTRFDHRIAPSGAPSLHFGQSEVSLEEFLLLYEAKLQTAERLSLLPQQQTESLPPADNESDTLSEDAASDSRLYPQSVENGQGSAVRTVITAAALTALIAAYLLLRKKKIAAGRK